MNATHEHTGGCRSRLQFDRWFAGELDSIEATRLEQHAAGCARCAALLVDLRRGYDAFAPVLPEPIVERLRARSARRHTRWLAWTAPALVAAAVLLAWRLWPEPGDAMPVGVRSKGTTQLTFYVLHDGAVRPGIDGERVQPGDRLEFAYASERDAYLAIVSIDAARKASTYYAKDGRAARISAASRALLEQSTLLDDTLGLETVYTLVCTQAIEVAPLLGALERAPDRAPVAAGCVVGRHSLMKVPK